MDYKDLKRRQQSIKKKRPGAGSLQKDERIQDFLNKKDRTLSKRESASEIKQNPTESQQEKEDRLKEYLENRSKSKKPLFDSVKQRKPAGAKNVEKKNLLTEQIKKQELNLDNEESLSIPAIMTGSKEKFSVEEKNTVSQEKFKKLMLANKFSLVAAGGVLCLFCLLITVLMVVKPQKTEEETLVNTKISDSQIQSMVSNDLQENAYPEINELVEKYYTAQAEGDIDLFRETVDVSTEDEEENLLASADMIEEYGNISCYSKYGIYGNDYFVFVYYELKFTNIATPAPGLTLLYIYEDESGRLVILNKDAEDEIVEAAGNVSSDDDVIELTALVQEKYEAAVEADADLAKLNKKYTKIKSDSEQSDVTEETEEGTEEPADEET